MAFSDVLYQNVPNPFNPVTTIRYSVGGTGRVELGVYDVGGRLVTRLVNATQPAGIYNVSWDGRDERGSQVSSGVYFYRLRTPGSAQTRKMVLLK